MRTRAWAGLGATLVTLAALVGPGAWAQSTQERLDDAKATRDASLAAQREAERTLEEYERINAELELAIRDVIIASRAERELSARLEEAQAELDRRARTAYELGPAMSLELFLGTRTPGDFASVQQYLARTFEVDEEDVLGVTAARRSLEDVSSRLERRRSDLAKAAMELRLLATEAAARLDLARAEADAASRQIEELEKALAEEQAAAAASLARLIDATEGFDQSELLALLGPNEGRGCEIPEGLEDTGQRVDGLSSWYGWEFAGQHTASGAIFDPRLFTVANKELPLSVFLRIHYKGKCAIALVNDRGPYGGGRVFDVSEAVADYLGYIGAGVVWVETDVLVPR